MPAHDRKLNHDNTQLLSAQTKPGILAGE